MYNVPVENYAYCKSGNFNSIVLKSETFFTNSSSLYIDFLAGLERGFGNGKFAVHKLKNAL